MKIFDYLFVHPGLRGLIYAQELLLREWTVAIIPSSDDPLPFLTVNLDAGSEPYRSFFFRLRAKTPKSKEITHTKYRYNIVTPGRRTSLPNDYDHFVSRAKTLFGERYTYLNRYLLKAGYDTGIKDNLRGGFIRSFFPGGAKAPSDVKDFIATLTDLGGGKKPQARLLDPLIKDRAVEFGPQKSHLALSDVVMPSILLYGGELFEIPPSRISTRTMAFTVDNSVVEFKNIVFSSHEELANVYDLPLDLKGLKKPKRNFSSMISAVDPELTNKRFRIHSAIRLKGATGPIQTYAFFDAQRSSLIVIYPQEADDNEVFKLIKDYFPSIDLTTTNFCADAGVAPVEGHLLTKVRPGVLLLKRSPLVFNIEKEVSALCSLPDWVQSKRSASAP